MSVKQIRVAGARGRVTALVGMTLMVSLVCLSGASVSFAAPKGIFSVFNECPTSVPGVQLCQHTEITTGEFSIGSMRVPINHAVTFQAGAIPTGGANFNEYFLIPASNGESLANTELSVSGGLGALLNCDKVEGKGYHRLINWFACKALVRYRMGVSVAIEPMANISNPAIIDLAALALESGSGLTLPVRMHFKSPLLGEGCVIGSEANPIELHLTDGTTSPPPPNKPIKGSAGTPASEFEKGIELTKISGSSLVDNAFAVPAATGCGRAPFLSSLITSTMNKTLGLPSAGGRSTAILNGTQYLAEVEAVVASEKF